MVPPTGDARAWRSFALAALVSTWLGSAAAQTGPFEEERDRFVQPPLTLPETLRGEVRQTGRTADAGLVDTIRGIFPAIGACWAPPAGLTKLGQIEITLRFSLRRDGALIGAPRITFATMGAETRSRELLAEASFEAIRRCTPLKLTKGFGEAVAGRPIAVRFIYQGPKGQGV